MPLPEKTKSLILALVKNNISTHALLIHAEFPTPLSSISKNLIQVWHDTKEQKNTPLNYESHPDIVQVYPDPTLKIDTIRRIQEITKYGPQTYQRQFVVIHHADTLTVQAANALLKLLETPPKGVCFILLTHNASKLLPTIISRCQRFFCQKFSEKKEEKYPVSLIEVFQMSLPERLELAEKISLPKDTLVEILNQWLQESISTFNLSTTQVPNHIFSTLHRLNYNVNSKLQIEHLMIKLGE